ncbi:uncharacterized protein METZ01_LOCUS387659, partial [marine metagenome]
MPVESQMTRIYYELIIRRQNNYTFGMVCLRKHIYRIYTVDLIS